MPRTDDPKNELYRNVGGTSGGFSEFIVGVLFLGLGGWLLLNRVIVTTGGAGYGGRWGMGFAFPGNSGVSPFGVMLVVLFVGVVFLFFDGRSIFGWLLSAGATLAIFGLIISDLHVFFQPTTLLMTLFMFVSMAAGLGLVLRALRPH